MRIKLLNKTCESFNDSAFVSLKLFSVIVAILFFRLALTRIDRSFRKYPTYNFLHFSTSLL